jgi:hypothetical protein
VAPKTGGSVFNRPVWRESPVGGAQGLRCDYYENIQGKQISSLRAAPAFPNRPDRTVQVGKFELSEDIADNYGVRIRGYLVPPASGKYRFSAVGDDGVELWLSIDDTPANVRRLVSYEACVQKNQWTARGDQQSPECELVAGRRYYLEAFLKEGTGHDYLFVAWKGPVSDHFVVIDGPFLQPWTEGVAASAQAVPGPSDSSRQAREVRLEALAPARAAIDEQVKANAAAYRYAEAAEVLKAGKAAWQNPAALSLVETAILRFELMGRLRAFVQAELAKSPARGVWSAFGGQADVTTATDEGVTVAPGRIIEWSKIPPDQMLRLVNATVPQAGADLNTKSVLLLAAAVYCHEVTGGLELAFKYRERALALQGSLTSLADRVLGGSPEALQAGVRMKASWAELARITASAAGIVEKVTAKQAELAAVTGLVPGLLAEYWLKNPYGSLNDVRNKGFLKNPADNTQILDAFETPRDTAEKFVARLRGYLVPSESGEYFFYLAADDQGEFWLSEDETPERSALVIKTESYCNYRVWDREKRRSKPIPLKKGQHYFVEALLREGEKNDHLSVAWSLAATDVPEIITSSNLLYAATAGFTPRAQEIRNQSEAGLQKVLGLLADINAVRAKEQERDDTSEHVDTAAADERQRQVDRAKAALRAAEVELQQIDATLQQLKAASRPGTPQT